MSIEARELALRFGVRTCDENGDRHGEELYCLGLDDILAMKEALIKQVTYTGNGTAGRENMTAPSGFLFQMPKQKPVAWMDEYGDVLSASTVDGTGLRNIPLYTAPPVQPEIIADANRYRWLRDRSENVIIDIASSRQWATVEGYKKQLDDLIDRELAKATPECLEMAEVITEPPNKEWVGLTDDEIQSCWDGDLSPYQMQCIREIEAKLKEKIDKFLQGEDYRAMYLKVRDELAELQQRPWVGLTGEEKSELWEISRAALPRYATYAILIESKLREKNP
jgi:hypothetical protein